MESEELKALRVRYTAAVLAGDDEEISNCERDFEPYEMELDEDDSITREDTTNPELAARDELTRHIRTGDVENIRKLLAEGVDVNGYNSELSRPIHQIWQAGAHAIEIAQILIEAGADVNARDHSNYSALYLVTLSQNSNVYNLFKFLVRNGARIHRADEDGTNDLLEGATSAAANILMHTGRLDNDRMLLIKGLLSIGYNPKKAIFVVKVYLTVSRFGDINLELLLELLLLLINKLPYDEFIEHIRKVTEAKPDIPRDQITKAIADRAWERRRHAVMAWDPKGKGVYRNNNSNSNNSNNNRNSSRGGSRRKSSRRKSRKHRTRKQKQATRRL